MLLICVFSFFVSASALFSPYPRGKESVGGKNSGQKVIITPYIEAGKYDEAKNLTKVTPFKENIESYAGYVTVDKKCDSNLFFWFFPAEKNFEKSPVSVWLQGGPGASSMYGLFVENGPFLLTPGNKVKRRKYSWTQVSSYIFIDNPVGTGYSYAKSKDCYSTDENEVGKNLLSAVKQILQMFPEIKSNPFFVTGESYAGKYVPALSYAIHKDTDTKQKINLQGLAIGNGLVDPFNQLIYSDYLYQLGLLDAEGRSFMKNKEDSCRSLITNKKWKEAYNCFDDLLNGDTAEAPTFFQNVTGFTYYFNFLYSNGQQEGDVDKFITQDYVSCCFFYFFFCCIIIIRFI